jgi:hypothetical protein
MNLQKDQYVPEEIAARLLHLSPRTLRNWRVTGDGPKFKRISKRAIRYRVGDLIDWAEGKTRKSTSDLGILNSLK